MHRDGRRRACRPGGQDTGWPLYDVRDIDRLDIAVGGAFVRDDNRDDETAQSLPTRRRITDDHTGTPARSANASRQCRRCQ